MSVLSTVAKPKKRAPIITIGGDAGTGKSSLAASFPNPIYIRAEDGIGRIARGIETPDAFPAIDKADDLWPQLIALLNEDHDYKTLVIDSVTKLEEIFIRSILDSDGRAKGINQALGGYGNGPSAVAAMHGRVRKAAGLLNERKNMNIVFIGHADLESMRLPDVDDYMRYSLRLMPKSIAPYVDDVDFVGFVRLVSALRGDDGDRKKVISNGDREIVCHATAASVSKNGLGITEPVDFPIGANPILEYFGAAISGNNAKADNGDTKAQEADAPKAKAKPNPKPKTEPMHDDVPAQDDARNDGFDASDFND